jgi:rfaE bifunctional protein kinase chain/domain
VTPERAAELLQVSRGRRVVLLGDLMMDEWVFGTVKRISPEAPIPVVRMPLHEEARANKPGGAGNVAAVLLALGAAVEVVGVVGDDERGRQLTQDLERRGAVVAGVLTDPSRPTTHKLRILAGRQQLLRIDTEDARPLSGTLARRLCETFAAAAATADVVLIADYAKGVLTPETVSPECLAGIRRRGTPVCADPKPGNIELLRGASLISPNESEALEAAGAANGPAGADAFGIPAAVAQAGRTLLARLQAEAILITRSEHGIAVFERGGAVAQVPTRVETGSVGDPTGCGDAASAAAALALAAGASFLEAAELANAAGGVVSRFVGVHDPRPQEVVDWLR